jgi:hypothetical protein
MLPESWGKLGRGDRPITTRPASGSPSASTGRFLSAPEMPTTMTPSMTSKRLPHWLTLSRRRRKMTENRPTQSTSAPRVIWYIDTAIISPGRSVNRDEGKRSAKSRTSEYESNVHESSPANVKAASIEPSADIKQAVSTESQVRTRRAPRTTIVVGRSWVVRRPLIAPRQPRPAQASENNNCVSVV